VLHGHEDHAGYIGVDNREEMAGKTVKWHVAANRGKVKAMQEGAEGLGDCGRANQGADPVEG
jgi:IS5 family transposase